MGGQWTFLLLLLLFFAAEAKQVKAKSMSEIKIQLQKLEREQLEEVFQTKTWINRIMKKNDEAKIELRQFGEKLTLMDEINKKLDENAQAIKSVRECQKLLYLMINLDRTQLLSAIGKSFYFNDAKVKWYEARGWCEQMGMQQATLRSMGDVEKVARELRHRGFDSSGFWFSASSQTPGQQFSWTHRTLSDNTTWLNGQQSDSHGSAKETCVLYSTESAKLYSNSCSDTWRILCEVPDAINSCH